MSHDPQSTDNAVPFDSETQDRLMAAALEARQQAYVPYSRFLVGAALLLRDGTIISGCNIENASYGLTNCAERTAIFSAIAQGRRDFVAIAVVGDTEDPISPCGACRQVLFEFGPTLPVLLGNLRGDRMLLLVQDLLPGGFGPGTLSGNRS
jgi:cytidine deaminase